MRAEEPSADAVDTASRWLSLCGVLIPWAMAGFVIAASLANPGYSHVSETVSLLKEVGLPPRRLTWSTPLPGSELYEEAVRQGLIEDEEAYVIKLHKGYNRLNSVVLNVSGNSDAEMIRLFNWTHMRMNVNYLTIMLMQRKIFKPIFWKHLRRTIASLVRYYAPSLQ